MSRDVYQYKFEAMVPMEQVGESLLLAAFASEGVHGRARVQLDADFNLDEKEHACTVDASTAAGRTVARVFTALLHREFGEGAFRVERVSGSDHRRDSEIARAREALDGKGA